MCNPNLAWTIWTGSGYRLATSREDYANAWARDYPGVSVDYPCADPPWAKEKEKEPEPECYKGRVSDENVPCCKGYELSISEEGNYSECVPASGHDDSSSKKKETTPDSCIEGRTISFSEVEADFFGYPKCPEGYLPDIVQAPNPLLFQPAYGACICSDLPPEEKQKIKSDGRDQYQKQKEKETETGILGTLNTIEKILPTLIILAVVSAVLGLFKR